MPYTILSPHPDDAVLSCWHLLYGPEDVRVIDLFAGAPDEDEPSWWDALTGASSARARAEERLREDGRALSLAGRRAQALDLPDGQYRREPLPVHRVLAELRPRLGDDDVILAPAALGQHPDHSLALEVGLALAGEGWKVRLYADLPHAILFGWPEWIVGRQAEPGLDVEGLWRRRLLGFGLRAGALEPNLHVLDGTAEAKSHAISAYRTQARALARMMPPDGLRYEVTWALGPRSRS